VSGNISSAEGRVARLASLAAGLCAVSTSALLIRSCQSSPTSIALFRLLGGGVILLVAEIGRRCFVLSRRDAAIALCAALFLAVQSYFWIESLFMTTIHSAVVLQATQPLFALAIQGVVLRAPVQRRNFVSLAVGLIGAAILAGGDFHRSGVAGAGDLLAILSAAMQACYLVAGSFRRGRLLSYLAVLYTTSALLMIPLGLARRESLLASRQIDWLWIGLLAVVPTLVGHTLLNRAMKHFPQYAVNVSILAKPVLTSIAAFIVFGQLVTGNVWLGGACIMGAILIEVLPPAEEKVAPETLSE
jgi:drug/metabolite transporter (DMT)-like permease